MSGASEGSRQYDVVCHYVERVSLARRRLTQLEQPLEREECPALELRGRGLAAQAALRRVDLGLSKA